MTDRGEPVDLARLVERHGSTLAEQADLDLDGSPDSLYRLLVLTLLLSKPIPASTALATARVLLDAGLGNPRAMAASTRQRRVSLLGRGGYRRYDFSTADRLIELTRHVEQAWGGDLTRLRGDLGDDPAAELTARVRAVPGIGPTGASIFAREVAAVWPELGVVADRHVRAGAQACGLPPTPAELARLHPQPHRLAAALAAVGRRPALLDSGTVSRTDSG